MNARGPRSAATWLVIMTSCVGPRPLATTTARVGEDRDRTLGKPGQPQLLLQRGLLERVAADEEVAGSRPTRGWSWPERKFDRRPRPPRSGPRCAATSRFRRTRLHRARGSRSTTRSRTGHPSAAVGHCGPRDRACASAGRRVPREPGPRPRDPAPPWCERAQPYCESSHSATCGRRPCDHGAGVRRGDRPPARLGAPDRSELVAHLTIDSGGPAAH